ncbi:hypothetical protein D3C73_1424540 [compost metagenome]
MVGEHDPDKRDQADAQLLAVEQSLVAGNKTFLFQTAQAAPDGGFAQFQALGQARIRQPSFILQQPEYLQIGGVETNF